MKFYDNDEIWDEHQWEAHLSDLEQQNEKFKGFIESVLNEKAEPRWMQMLDEYKSELDLMNAYIEEELLIEDAYFPDDDDWEEDEDEFEDPLFDELEEYLEQDIEAENENGSFLDEDFDDELDDWDFEGEEWKGLSDEFAQSDYGSIEQLKVYVEARDLGAEIFRLMDHRKDLLKKEEIKAFVSDAVQIAAKLAGGYAFGFENDVLGANIAYSKKALQLANKALEDLQQLKSRKVFVKADYYRIHGRLYEVRNDIGIYIQELRERFYENL